MTVRLTRREFAVAGGAAMLALPAAAQNTTPLKRSIPRSGELLPAVGLVRGSFARCAARRCPIGRTPSPTPGRSFS